MPYTIMLYKERRSDQYKKQICVMYNNNEDWKALYTTLWVKKSTAYRLVKSQQEIAKQRGGIKRFNVTDYHKESVCWDWDTNISDCLNQTTKIVWISQCVYASNSKIKTKYIKEIGIKYIYKNIYVKHTIIPW